MRFGICHARITEAVQLMLRESQDTTKQRQTQFETRIVETNKPTRQHAPTPSADAVQATTAREARRLLETLNAAPMHEERPALETMTQRPKKPRDVVDTSSKRLDKPRHDEPVHDKPTQTTCLSPRAGAPRWGVMGPRPMKVRRVSTFQVGERNVVDDVDACSTPKTSR